MHRAGKFLAYETEKFAKQQSKLSQRIVVLCGHGNNGGDGWVAAEYLAKTGFDVDLISSLEAQDIKAEPAHTTACEQTENLETYPNARILINPTYEEVEQSLSQADLIIDALLGTGFSGDTIREPFATWITLSDQSNLPIVAADVPSGFSAQTGNAATPCIRAAHTVTMIALKTGLTHPNAQKYCGTIRVAPLIDTTPYLA